MNQKYFVRGYLVLYLKKVLLGPWWVPKDHIYLWNSLTNRLFLRTKMSINFDWWLFQQKMSGNCSKISGFVTAYFMIGVHILMFRLGFRDTAKYSKNKVCQADLMRTIIFNSAMFNRMSQGVWQLHSSLTSQG